MVDNIESDFRPKILFPNVNNNVEIDINNYFKWKIDFCERWTGHEIETHKKMISYLKNIKPGEIIIDAGAHVGDTGILLAIELKKMGKNNIVYEIDPDKSKLDFIEKIAKYNKINNIKTFHCGLSNKKGRGKLNKDLHAGAWSVTEGNDFDLIKLDNIVRDKKVSLIHFDLEGMEHKALMGSKNTIKRDNPEIIIEINHDKKDLAQDFLKKLNYKIIWQGENNTWNVKK